MRRLGSREYGTEPSESGTETSLLEAIETHAIFTLDTEGRITRWSAPAASLYGRDAGSVLGRHLRTLFADGDHDETDSPAATLLSAAGEGPTEAEHWHERGDGSVFWGTLALSPRQEEVSGGYVAVCRDTTIDKEYERMLERQNDRLKEFTDILAHDLRNPLNVIEAHVTLYEETGDDEHIETIDETTERMARLVEDLLRVAKQGGVVEDPEPTDLRSVVDTAWAGTGEPTGAALSYEPVRTLSADPDRLCELAENLFRNAIEHASTAALSPATGDASDSECPAEGATEGKQSSLTVSVGSLDDGFYIEDNGPGIPEEIRDAVFDHGFSTATEGNGYGLSIVRTIVNAHGWDIDARAGNDGGARFEVTNIEFLD